jgi:acyl phosphate:glycerol-3-phosphate acyltransferase
MQGSLPATQLALAALALLVGGYVIGGIPWALLIGKWVKGVDLRTIGSGNLGATNVARNVGGGWAVAVFFLDFAKGALPVAVATLAPLANQDALMMAAALGAVLGHVYSPYIRFRGGKGIAVTAGAAAVANPLCLIVGTVIFFAVGLSTRRVSLGSLTIGLAYPPLTWYFYPERPVNLAFAFAACALVVWSHRANIGRLVRGEEPKVSWGIFKNDK